MRTNCRRYDVLIVTLAMALLAGCGKNAAGPERGAVHGKVTANGQAIAKGRIAFVPADLSTGSSWETSIADGQYTSEKVGPIVGKCRIEIRASRQATSGPQAAEGDWKSSYVEAIPPRYNSQSKLEADVKSGDNTFDFELKLP